jgi:hypothetical protein
MIACGVRWGIAPPSVDCLRWGLRCVCWPWSQLFRFCLSAAARRPKNNPRNNPIDTSSLLPTTPTTTASIVAWRRMPPAARRLLMRIAIRTNTDRRFRSEKWSGTIWPARLRRADPTTIHAAAAAVANLSPSSVHANATATASGPRSCFGHRRVSASTSELRRAIPGSQSYLVLRVAVRKRAQTALRGRASSFIFAQCHVRTM